jgi:hypothetical protein
VLGWKPRWGIQTAVEKAAAFARSASDDERLACIDGLFRDNFYKEMHHTFFFTPPPPPPVNFAIIIIPVRLRESGRAFKEVWRD